MRTMTIVPSTGGSRRLGRLTLATVIPDASGAADLQLDLVVRPARAS